MSARTSPIAPFAASRWLPATAGTLVTACRDTDAGYTCPQRPQATLNPAAWTPTEPGAAIVFAVPLAASETLTAVRGKLDCAPGDGVTVKVVANDPDRAWQTVLASADATCAGSPSEVDLAPSATVDPAGYRYFSVEFDVAKFGCQTVGCAGDGGTVHIRGVELAVSP